MTNEVPLSDRPANVRLFRRVLRSPMAVISAAVFIAVAVLCFAAPWLTSYAPQTAELADVLAPPWGQHVLGADASGRDVLSRLLYGGQETLIGAFIATAVAIVLGVPAGLVSGYYQGRTGAVLEAASNVLLSVPAQLVLIALIAAIGPNMFAAMAVLGVLTSPSIYRLLRGTVISVRQELYIDAAKVSGVRDWQILVAHVLPVVRGPLIIQSAMVAGGAVLLQTGIEFLGLGNPSRPSWGSLLDEGFTQIYRAPTLVLWPSIALTVTLSSIALFASALRDILSDTQASARVSKRSERKLLSRDAGFAAVPSNSLLSVRDLAVSYPLPGGGSKEVVRNVSFDVGKGEIVGLVGESGSGKSQTAYAILGLLDPGGRVSGGSIWFDGQRMQNAGASPSDALGRRIAYVPQEPLSNLDPSFTIGHQLIEPMRKVLHLSTADARARAVELLRQVEIRDPEQVMKSYPHQVSGGMAQRILIAGAVSCEPALIVADEPTTALDVTVQAGILRLLRRLRDERGLSILIVTHNFGVVADLCDRVAVMSDGRVIETQPVADLFAAPGEPYTRALLAATLEGKPSLVERERERTGRGL